MRRFVMVVSFFVLAHAAAFGQTATDARGWGYGFGAVGGTSGGSVPTLHVGGGGEGFSLAFRNGTSGGGNFGGGVQYWARPHLGLRFEFRDHVFSSDTPHLYGFRVGLSFR